MGWKIHDTEDYNKKQILSHDDPEDMNALIFSLLEHLGLEVFEETGEGFIPQYTFREEGGE